MEWVIQGGGLQFFLQEIGGGHKKNSPGKKKLHQPSPLLINDRSLKSEDGRSSRSLSKNREVPLFVENLHPTWAFEAEVRLRVVIGLGL